MVLPLESLKRGDSAVVAEVTGDSYWLCRLAELGLRPGVSLTVIQPGCPCLFQLGSSRLSLRLSDQLSIRVQVLAKRTLPSAEVA